MAEKSRIETYDTQQILQQMREEYWRGLTEVEEQVHKDLVQVLTFHLAGEFYAVDAHLCKTVLKVPNITRVPQTPAHVLGVINIRGRITSVVDLRTLFDLPRPELGPRARLILVEAGETSTALVAETVEDIIFKSLSELKPPVRGLTKMKTEFVKGYFHHEQKPEETLPDPQKAQEQAKGQELLIYLDLEQIILSPEMTVNFRGR